MKRTESTWFKKYRNDYLCVADILSNSRADDLVSKMEWFDDKIISKFQGSSYRLLKGISFRNRAKFTDKDKRKTALFFYKIKNSKYPNVLFSLSLLLNLFLSDCQRNSLPDHYKGSHFCRKIKKENLLAKNYDTNHLLNRISLFFDLLSIDEKRYTLNFILGSNESDIDVLFSKFKNLLRLTFKKAIFNNWFLDTSLIIKYDKDGNLSYVKSNNLSIFFDLDKNCLRAANNKSYFLNEDIDSYDSSDELITSYFIAKPGQIKVFKDINVLTLERFNSRKSLDFLGEIFSEYLKRFVCEDHFGTEYFLRDMFLKYPNILMEIILKDSIDIFKNNLDKFINSETCKISLLRHGGNLPVYVDLKEDDHTKYHYL